MQTGGDSSRPVINPTRGTWAMRLLLWPSDFHLRFMFFLSLYHSGPCLMGKERVRLFKYFLRVPLPPTHLMTEKTPVI